MIESQNTSKLKKCYNTYMLGILLTIGRKTCRQMSKSLAITHDELTRALNAISKGDEGMLPSLITAAHTLLDKTKKWWFVTDDTMIHKPHIKKLKQAILDRSGATGRVEHGLVVVFLAITDGDITVPLGYRIWINKKNIADESLYKKKYELCIELAKDAREKIECNAMLIDGIGANRYALAQLNELNFEYEIRFRKNGQIVYCNQKSKIVDIMATKLTKNRRYVTIKAQWQGLDLFFTAHKHRRDNKSEKHIITYTVSNRYVTAKEHAIDYLKRWRIEKFFRTAKQSLGLQHCAVTHIAKQKAHINSCMLAYAFLQEKEKREQLASPECALDAFRNANFPDLSVTLNALDQSYAIFA